MNVPQGLVIKDEAFGDNWIESIGGKFYICSEGTGMAYDKNGKLYKKKTRKTIRCISLNDAVFKIITYRLINSDQKIWSMAELLVFYKKFADICAETK